MINLVMPMVADIGSFDLERWKASFSPAEKQSARRAGRF
jgi:hypothetical protein